MFVENQMDDTAITIYTNSIPDYMTAWLCFYYIDELTKEPTVRVKRESYGEWVTRA